MKKFTRVLTAFAVSVAMMLTNAVTASAVEHKPGSGCASKELVTTCGEYWTTTVSSHLLHTNVYCKKTGTVKRHYKACAGCGYENSSLGGRVCSWDHQYCPDEIGVCKY